ncbi:MAG: glycosyltransferase [Sphingobacteriales bacterium JAD_PAG50586_3]|nr:MAG: glycosyltransferase [Sphingobacteriales bacterium JAD_PAG50586_3]
MKFSIVIPIYNSAAILPVLIPEITGLMDSRAYKYQIIAVDDHSTDNSWQVLSNLKQQYPQLHAIRLAKNAGQWMATSCGINKAQGDVIITIDDDREYNSTDILKLIDFFETNPYALVYGVPMGKGKKNLSYKLFYGVRNFLQNTIAGQGNTESFRIFKRSLVTNPNPQAPINSFYIDAYFKHAINRKDIGYLNVGYQQRQVGRSGFSVLKKLLFVARFGPEYFVRPLMWVLALTAVIACVDFIKLYNYWQPLVYLQKLIPYLYILAFVVVGFYLAQIYLLLKGKPVYVITEELV